MRFISVNDFKLARTSTGEMVVVLPRRELVSADLDFLNKCMKKAQAAVQQNPPPLMSVVQILAEPEPSGVPILAPLVLVENPPPVPEVALPPPDVPAPKVVSSPPVAQKVANGMPIPGVFYSRNVRALDIRVGTQSMWVKNFCFAYKGAVIDLSSFKGNGYKSVIGTKRGDLHYVYAVKSSFERKTVGHRVNDFTDWKNPITPEPVFEHGCCVCVMPSQMFNMKLCVKQDPFRYIMEDSDAKAESFWSWPRKE